jgi:hypothetical protein
VACLVNLQHAHHWDHIHKARIWKQSWIINTNSKFICQFILLYLI